MDFSHLIMLADFGTTAAVIGTVVTIASVAASMYQMSNQPDAPGTNTNAEGIKLSAALLPKQRQMASAAQQGGKVLRNGFTAVTREQLMRLLKSKQEQFDDMGPKDDWKPLESEIQQLRHQIETMKPGETLYRRASDGELVSEKFAMADFTGFGEADVQGKIATDYADMIIELGDKYGEDFVKEAREQLKLADPEGWAARQKMDSMIQEQIGKTPERPVAELLDAQVGEQLAAGNKLDGLSRDVLDASVADAIAARGQGGDSNTFAAPLETGLAGDARRQAAMQKAAGWLSSGATPEDVQFRREQQNLANLGAFIGGQTPQAQFANLSGAQRGATPISGGGALPQMNPNAGASSQQFAMNNWQTAMQSEGNQANPWMAGISSVLGVASAAGKAGWKPFGSA